MLWNTEYWGNPISSWTFALGAAVLINCAAACLKWLVTQRLSVLAKKTTTNLDDSLLEVVRATQLVLVLAVSIFVASKQLELPDKANAFLAAAAGIATIVQVGLWLNALMTFWLNQYRGRATRENAGVATSVDAMGFLGKIALWTLVLLLALDNLGVNVTALVAGLGVGGIAVALAVQNILGDLFASLSIVVDKPFVIGDFIIVDEYMGTVEHIGLKTTRIRSLGGEQIIFSNGDLLKARLRNYKRMYQRRAVFGFGVLYETHPDELERIPALLRTIIEAQPLARFDRAHFMRFSESSLDFEVVYWVLDPDHNKYMDIQQAINLELVRVFVKMNIGFAYPTRTLKISRESNGQEVS